MGKEIDLDELDEGKKIKELEIQVKNEQSRVVMLQNQKKMVDKKIASMKVHNGKLQQDLIRSVNDINQARQEAAQAKKDLIRLRANTSGEELTTPAPTDTNTGGVPVPDAGGGVPVPTGVPMPSGVPMPDSGIPIPGLVPM